MADLEKLVALGEKMGLSGQDLLKYIQEREAKEDKKREEEFQREEKKREEDQTRKEEDFQREERRKKEEYEREERRAEREKQKLELELKIKMEENKKNGKPEAPRTSSKAPKLPTFVDMKDDLDAYLGRFERYATAQK